jgi:fumarate reductase subunit C
VARGPEAYARFLSRLGTPLFVFLHVVVFLFVLFHSITWFNLAPKAMVVRVKGQRVPDAVVIALNYGAWLVLSGAVAFVLLQG